MKHLIILADGMADHPVGRLGGKTPLQYVRPQYIDTLARLGRCGRLVTVPDHFQPGSEVANTSILGYDLPEVYEGRGPLEAASIGYEMRPDDLALRCNLITLANGVIKNHHGGHLDTQQGDILIRYLDAHLGNDHIRFMTGTQYRHLLIIRGGNKHIDCAPPHDHPEQPWKSLLVRPLPDRSADASPGRMSPEETALLLNDLIIRSQQLLDRHPFNASRTVKANSIWPWGGGYRPRMKTLAEMYPAMGKGAVISAVDLIQGIGRYAGLKRIDVPGITGQADTNYEGKASAAIDALRNGFDFVFLHVEASDEAGHDGDLDLKIKTIADLDRRIVKPIFDEVSTWTDDPVCIAVLPDHPTPVEIRTHVAEPVPFLIWHPGITPDSVDLFDESSTMQGSYGLLPPTRFMHLFSALPDP